MINANFVVDRPTSLLYSTLSAGPTSTVFKGYARGGHKDVSTKWDMSAIMALGHELQELSYGYICL